MARGGPPRKDGPRKPCGRLQPAAKPPDAGPEMVRLRRAERVGAELAADPKAEHMLGRMELANLLIDPALRPADGDARSEEAEEQSCRRYDAGLRYAADHTLIYGSGTVPSHLKNLVTGLRVAFPDARDDTRLEAVTLRHKTKYAEAMTTPPAGRLLGHHALERAVLHEVFLEDARDQETLRRVLDRIGGAKRKAFFHDKHPEMASIATSAGDCADESILPPVLRRSRGLPVIFYPELAERSDAEKAAIAAAAAKLKRRPETAEAD